MDFAFFVANFGYSKAEYNALTPAEKLFILKAYEDRVVSQSTLMAKAVLNAVGNAMRKKGKPFLKLWRKKPQRTDKEMQENRIEKLLTQEKKSGKSWVERIYRENQRRMPMKKGGTQDAGN